MNILKLFISFMLATVGMFSTTSVFAQASEAVFSSYEECAAAGVAYTPVGRNEMRTGRTMHMSDIHPSFVNGVCVHSTRVVKRINGRPQVTSGWVFLLGDFLVVEQNGGYYMKACSNPISHIGAPFQTEVRTQVNAPAPQLQVSSVQQQVVQQPQVVERVYVDRQQVQPQQRERFCDRHSRGCDFVSSTLSVAVGNFLGQGACNNNGWCRGGGNSRRYNDNNGQWPPRRRPGEPIFDRNRAGDSNLNRPGAGEPIFGD